MEQSGSAVIHSAARRIAPGYPYRLRLFLQASLPDILLDDGVRYLKKCF